MTLLTVRHITTYRYRQPVSFGQHRMMFRPRDSFDQKLLDARLSNTPEPSGIRWVHDAFGNCVAIVEFPQHASEELRFESNIWLDHSPSTGPEFQIEEAARRYPFLYDPEEMPDLMPAIRPQYPDPDHTLHDWVRRFLRNDQPADTGTLLMTLTYALRESFTYERRAEPGTRPPALTLKLRRGSCRDLALLLIEALRSLGLAARFVTGYLYVRGRDGEGYRGGGSTWCEVYLPGAGWVELDPTNAIVGNRDLIRVAVARDPSQAVPLSGAYFGTADDFREMAVDVRVRAEPLALT